MSSVLLNLLLESMDLQLILVAGPAVVFMLKHLKLSGCSVSSKDIICSPCDYTRAGGFSPEAGAVILCQGRFFSKNHMEDTLVHEFVHMYDHAKFKVDWSNLRHHACSEVRNFLLMCSLVPFHRADGSIMPRCRSGRTVSVVIAGGRVNSVVAL